MKAIRVGLNGFGRIGRAFTRKALQKNTFAITAINTRKTLTEMMGYLLQYDSVYRQFEKKIEVKDNSLFIEDKEIKTLKNDSPEKIPWNEFDVDIVVDATGAFVKKENLQKHIRGSVKKVILTAPAKDEATPHVVLGVNDNTFNFQEESVISNASCTTNCAAPMFKVLNDVFGVKSGFLTTAHSYTLTQSLLDDAGKDFERSRAAALNLIPSTTGAAKAVSKVIPELEGKIDGMALRIPTPTVSFTDISAVVERETSIEEVNNAFQTASESEEMKGIVSVEKNILVSSDFIGNPYSCIFDRNYTKVISGNFVKIFGWYDNEWGYSCRLVDLVERLSDYI